MIIKDSSGPGCEDLVAANLISGQLPQGGGMWGALHTPTLLHSPSAFHWGHSFLLWGCSGSEPEPNSLKITPTIARVREKEGEGGREGMKCRYQLSQVGICSER